MSGSSAAVQTERRGSIVQIRIHRPEQLNALDIPTFQEFRRHLGTAARDDSVRAVILTGAGRAFCAGGDVAAMEHAERTGTLPQFFHDLTGEQELAVREILGMAKPVLAALPGVAAGGGLALALSADWRIATPETVLVPAFPSLGAVPDGGLTYLLPHFLGIGLAQELLFTAARVPANRARELGLLHEVVESKELSDRAWARAEELARGPVFAYGWMKRLMLSAFSGSLEAQLALERRGAVEAAARPELREGISAFRSKRPPNFPAAK
jgi:2-(1,2-epoxy-1,2-dihydrophenyl)acetyl-CoA isomerase